MLLKQAPADDTQAVSVIFLLLLVSYSCEELILIGSTWGLGTTTSKLKYGSREKVPNEAAKAGSREKGGASRSDGS